MAPPFRPKQARPAGNRPGGHARRAGAPPPHRPGDIDEAVLYGVHPVVEALRTGGVDATIQRYPDAGHAFFNDTNPLAYRPADAADAWQRTLAFLEASLGSSAGAIAQ